MSKISQDKNIDYKNVYQQYTIAQNLFILRLITIKQYLIIFYLRHNSLAQKIDNVIIIISMKKNITLIGMPGAGKSTTGIILAKNLSRGFLDSDILIQINRGQSLQEILDERGYLKLREIEEEEILKINISNNIIATGGSAVYSEKAMMHLKNISTVVFLYADYNEIEKRINNFESRGIAKADKQSFYELYREREILYERYADFTVNSVNRSQDEVAIAISEQIS